MPITERPIRLLIVDDSPLWRRVLTQRLGRFPGIEIAGVAEDPYAARELILSLKPDVVTLDIEMPRMDGITFLGHLMKHRPVPVVVMSSVAGRGSVRAMDALQAGAVDVAPKPASGMSDPGEWERIATLIRAAARARISVLRPGHPTPIGREQPVPPEDRGAVPGSRVSTPGGANGGLILIGASTGGIEALGRILPVLPVNLPGICLVQHIPAGFSTAFSQRLNDMCQITVREAEDGDSVVSGTVFVAPGGRHLILNRHGAGYRIRLSDGPKVHYQRPSVDVLFDSALRAGAAPRALAVLLTGMGVDGAVGMLNLLKAGAETVAQDEATSVIYGMPGEAARLQAAQRILPVDQISSRIIHFARNRCSAESEPFPAGL